MPAVGDHMSRNVLSVEPDVPIVEVALGSSTVA